MRTHWSVSLSAAVFAAVASTAASASEPGLSNLQVAVACAVPPTVAAAAPADAMHIVGSQGLRRRRVYGGDDLLVIDGGTSKNVQLGQEFTVRRVEYYGMPGAHQSHAIRTAGWVKVVAVNETTAIAQAEHVCADFMVGDYLEPFVAPELPANADHLDTSGDLDFGHMARIVRGDRSRENGGAGDFMIIDRGRDQGAEPGARFAVYRDMHEPGVPLVALGEAVVVNAAPSLAVVRLLEARDAVIAGDYLVPRR